MSKKCVHCGAELPDEAADIPEQFPFENRRDGSEQDANLKKVECEDIVIAPFLDLIALRAVFPRSLFNPGDLLLVSFDAFPCLLHFLFCSVAVCLFVGFKFIEKELVEIQFDAFRLIV